jgi:uncharacterized protein
MSRQVIVIHGGETFATYDKYLAFLRAYEIDDPALVSPKGWKDNLAERLGDGFQVLQPKMPNKLNASYAEWSIWFEKYLPYAQDDVILVGHSLGGIFLAKWLAENEFPKRIAATFLIAAPAEATGPEDSLADFVLPEDLFPFAKQGGRIVLYFSKDDPVVPVSHKDIYVRRIPRAETMLFQERGHFLQEEFPELVAAIKGV